MGREDADVGAGEARIGVRAIVVSGEPPPCIRDGIPTASP
jgi:hypothetical protein